MPFSNASHLSNRLTKAISLALVITLLAATSCKWTPVPSLEARVGYRAAASPLLLFGSPPDWASSAPLNALAPGGALVDMSDLTLRLPVMVLSIDTLLGTRQTGGDTQVRGTFDSAAGAFVWEHEMSWNGTTFVDSTGYTHDLSQLADGDAVPGTGYLRKSSTEIRTLGNFVHRFDAQSGRLDRSYWQGTPSVFLDYVESGDDVRVDQCSPSLGCEEVLTYDYDAQGRLVGLSDRAGRSAELIYDADGNLVQLRDPQAIENGWAGKRFEYSSPLFGLPQLVAVTTQEGERTEFDYQDGERILRIRPIGENNPIYGFLIHPSGSEGVFAATVVNPLGHTCTFYFDAERRLQKILNAVGETHLYAWSGFDIVSETDAWGATTTRTFTQNSRTETLPNGNVIVSTLAPAGENRPRPQEPALLSVNDELGPVASFAYDGAGRLISENLGNETTSYGLDAEGRIVSISLTTSAGVLLQNYVNGSPQEIVHVSDPGDQLPDIVEHYVYDAVGNAVESPEFSTPEQAGRPGLTRVRWDGNRNRIALTGIETAGAFLVMLNAETQIVRRSDGRKSAIVRPYGGPFGAGTRFDYDALGRPVARCEQVTERSGVTLEHCTEMGYDAVGNLIFEEDAAGRRQEFDYDAVNRVVEARRSGPGLVPHSLQQVWEGGKIVSRHDTAYGLGGASENLIYDAAGNLTWQIHPAKGEVEGLNYDPRGRVVQRDLFLNQGAGVYLALVSLGFEYSGGDRVTRMTRDGELLVEADLTGDRNDELRFGNGLTRRFVYDSWDGRLVAASTTDAAGNELESTIHYRAGCGVPSLYGCANENTTTPLGSTQQSFLVGPAEGAELAIGTAPGARVVSYQTSDADFEQATTGNSEDHHAGWEDSVWVDYDGLNGAVRDGTQLYGNRLFQYNAERNRLEASLLAAPGGQTTTEHEYFYDEAGYVVQRDNMPISYNALGRIAVLGARLFAYDGLNRPIWSGEFGADQTTLFGGSVLADPWGNPVSMEIGRVKLNFEIGGGNEYHHLDFRGNLKFVSDDGGNIVSHLRYTPWGLDETLGEATERDFAMGTALEEGLVLLGARVYDPIIRSFLSPDPIYQTLSQFAYAEGNPVHLWDPTGTQPSPVAAAAVVGGGGIIAQSATAAVALGASAAVGAALLVAGIAIVLVGIVLAIASIWPSGSEVTAIGSLSSGGFGSCSPLSLEDAEPLAIPPGLAWLAFIALLGASLAARRKGGAISGNP